VLVAVDATGRTRLLLNRAHLNNVRGDVVDGADVNTGNSANDSADGTIANFGTIGVRTSSGSSTTRRRSPRTPRVERGFERVADAVGIGATSGTGDGALTTAGFTTTGFAALTFFTGTNGSASGLPHLCWLTFTVQPKHIRQTTLCARQVGS